MFFFGIHEIKKRVIEFLQDTLGNRPLFERVNILNKYAEVEREKINVVVTGSSLDNIQLSPDNFLTKDLGHAFLAKVQNEEVTHPAYFMSWVRDDFSTQEVQDNRVAGGFYFLTLNNVTQDGATLQIDVLHAVKSEVVLFNYTGEAQVQLDNFPVHEGSLQLFVDDALYPPNEPADYYDVDLETGIITFNRIPALGSQIRANYNWTGTSLPDTFIERGIGRTDILTGVLLGFSEEFVEGDRAVVGVTDEVEPSALTFGGRLNMTLSFDTRAQDTILAEKVVDMLSDTLWGVAKPALKEEGLDIAAVNIGGEAVDPEDEVGQEWAFQFSLSMNIEAEWQRRIPLLRRWAHGVVNLPCDVDLLSATDEELIEASLRFKTDPEIGPQVQLPPA